MIAEITRDAELYKQPKDSGPSHGVLPKGTLLRLTGQQESFYYSVEVELEQGVIEGWVKEGFLNLEQQQKEKKKRESIGADGFPPPVDPKKAGEAVPAKKRAKLRVPKDEGLLLYRQPTFFFGAHGGGTYSIIPAINGSTFSGAGFSLGVHVGTFLRQNIPLRIELGYSNQGGADASGNPASFAFMELGATCGYLYEGFEFFGRLHYGLAISVSNLPGGLNTTFGPVSDLSSLWIGAGAAYRIPVNEMSNLSIRGLYSMSFLQSPFIFHMLGLQMVFDVNG